MAPDIFLLIFSPIALSILAEDNDVQLFAALFWLMSALTNISSRDDRADKVESSCGVV